MLKRDENQMQGNSNAGTDFRPTTLTDLAALKAAFDKVMTLLIPPAYAFGKGGYTNVQQGLITKAIDEFITPACNFPSLTIDKRNVLIAALRSLEVARSKWTTAKSK
jgi:hypothetical protein